MHVSDPDAVVRLTVRPHLERGGFHLDRFDAYLDGELIVTSRQPLLDGARRLLERGFDPEALLTMQMHDRPYDSFQPKPMRELAEWTIKELDRRGLRRQRWEPFQYARPAHPIHARSADQSLAVGWDSLDDRVPVLDGTRCSRNGMPTSGLGSVGPLRPRESSADKKDSQ